jgi:hypothetical protein
MKAMKIGFFVLAVFLNRCERIPKPVTSTSVVVCNSSGTPLIGAEVFLNGQLKGITDGAGQFVFSPWLSTGDKLFARYRVYEHPSYRPDHGPGSGWVERVYQMSRIVNNDGSVTDLTVTNPKATQTLTVSPNNALFGWHLVVSLDWDASDEELSQLETRFNDASEYLYNLTDGQFVIEQVEIADDGQLWGSAEIAFQVDTWVWPHTNSVGGFLGHAGSPAGSHIYMSPFSVAVLNASTDHRTIIHELGHLAFALQDEYIPFGKHCTVVRDRTKGGKFGGGASLAACVMDDQTDSTKLCSAYRDSLHETGNWQPIPCWDTIAVSYKEPRAGVALQDSWIVRTPDMRGTVVGTLPAPLPQGLRPKITKTNQPRPNLCEPITVQDFGPAAAGDTVWVIPPQGRSMFTAGRLDSNRRLEVRGVHLGEQIWSRWHTWIVDGFNAKCDLTQ